jgi:hypothetical protein
LSCFASDVGGAVADKTDLIAAIYDAIIGPSAGRGIKRIIEETKSFQGNLVLQQSGAGSFRPRSQHWPGREGGIGKDLLSS